MLPQQILFLLRSRRPDGAAARRWPLFRVGGHLCPLLGEFEPMISFRRALSRRCVTMAGFSPLSILHRGRQMHPPIPRAGFNSNPTRPLAATQRARCGKYGNEVSKASPAEAPLLSRSRPAVCVGHRIDQTSKAMTMMGTPTPKTRTMIATALSEIDSGVTEAPSSIKPRHHVGDAFSALADVGAMIG